MSNEILDDNFQQLDFDNATITKINLLKIDVQEHQKHIRNAGIMLIFMGVVALVQLLYFIYSINDTFITMDIMMPVFIRLALIIVLYFACAIGLKFRPLPALFIGTAIFTLPIIAMLWTLLTDFYIDGGVFLLIVFRFVPYYFLIRGLIAALKRRKDLEKLRDLGIPLEEIKLAERLKTMPRTNVVMVKK